MKNKIRKIWACIKSYRQECFCDYRTFWMYYLIVLLIIVIIYFVFSIDWTKYHYYEQWGQLGDTLGGTTAPAIGLISIYLLYKTLRSQINFNNEQKRQAFDEQFKSTLFNLLEVQRDIKDHISGRITFLDSTVVKEGPIKSNNGELDIRGEEFFGKMIYLLRHIFLSLENTKYYSNYSFYDAANALNSVNRQIICGPNFPPEIEEDFNARLKSAKEPFVCAYVNDLFKITKANFDAYHNLQYNSQKAALGYFFLYSKYDNVGVYFRHLYHILKFIDQTKKDEIKIFYGGNETKELTNKYMEYAQFIQAQMSFDELLLLFYNSFAFKKLQQLLSEYNILENLNVESLIDSSHNCVEGLLLKSQKDLYTKILEEDNNVTTVTS